MFNTRAETLFEKKFKKDLLINQRCLIPVNCYYEWKKEGKQKTAYSFEIKNRDIIFLGGIYSIWQDSYKRTKRYSCSIITTEANPEVKQIHNRMPLIISEDKVIQWLNRKSINIDEISKLIVPYQDEGLQYCKVSHDNCPFVETGKERDPAAKSNLDNESADLFHNIV